MRLTLHGQRCIRHKDVFTSSGSGHKTFPGPYSLGYAVVTRRTMDRPYRTIETASNKPRLEVTGPESTSLGTRILTFLPSRRYVVTEK
jgi:hypothetical protein